MNEPTPSETPRARRFLLRPLEGAILLVWLGTNTVIWFWPDLNQAAKKFVRNREINVIAAPFYACGHGDSLVGKVDRLDYLMFAPAVASEQKVPLLVFLHGSGGRGTDLKGVFNAMGNRWTQSDWQHLHPHAIVAPQCPPDLWWADSRMLESLEQMLDEVIDHQNIDTNRIYLVGYSMGGYGTWAWAAQSPERFAAIIPAAGGGSTSNAKRLISLPIWAIHGSNDRTVKVENTETIIAAIRDAGGSPKFAKLEGAGHGVRKYVSRVPNRYLTWMFQQSRK